VRRAIQKDLKRAAIAFSCQLYVAAYPPGGFIAPCLPIKTTQLPSGRQRRHELHYDLRPEDRWLASCGEKLMSRPRKTTRERMSEWVLHCAVNQRHIRRSQPTRKAALKDACAQLLEGHAVNRIVGPSETITGERVRDWCAKHRPSFRT
jgi:hypothetical protein